MRLMLAMAERWMRTKSFGSSCDYGLLMVSRNRYDFLPVWMET